MFIVDFDGPHGQFGLSPVLLASRDQDGAWRTRRSTSMILWENGELWTIYFISRKKALAKQLSYPNITQKDFKSETQQGNSTKKSEKLLLSWEGFSV